MPRPDNVSFSDHLKAWRRDRSLTQAQVAEILGVSKITINNWESGNHDPRDIDSIEERLRELQTAKGEPPVLTRDLARNLWRL